MSKKIMVAALLGAMALPVAAQAQSRVAIPNVELFATVTGKWVLDPRRCRDIREDVRDARVTESRRDRREDRRDQRIADCPPSAYDFIVDAGQGPKHPVRVGRGRVQRKYRGRPIYINGDTIGPNGEPTASPGYAPRPTYQQPTYQQPTYSAPTVFNRPTYQQPTYQQPAYQQPTYQTQPNYQSAPNSTYQNGQQTYTAPTTTYTQPAAPSQPSNYRIENGVIIFE